MSLYQLPPTGASALLEAWDRCPLSPYGERQRQKWDKRNVMRSKSKMYDVLRVCLTEVLGVHIGAMDDDKICVCDFDNVCEVCASLEALGLDRYSTRDHAITQLAALQGKLETARAAAQNGARS